MPDPINPAVTRAVVKAVDRLTTQVGRIADALTTAVDVQPTTPDDEAPPEHRGGNAEDCPACADTNPPYPFICPHPAPADEEQTLRWARRESLLVLFTRLQRGRTLAEDEARTLREHVEHEMREADTARSVAAGNKRHVQLMHAEVERANAVTAETKKLLERRTTTLRQRAEIAETELRTLRTGLRAAGGDPTTIQNLWAQIRMRNRQWAEAKRERDTAQAAIERVRAVEQLWAGKALPHSEAHRMLTDVRAALDGPTETQQN